MDNIDRYIEKILDLDKSVQRALQVNWPESWLQINLPLGSSRALLAIDRGYANTPSGIAALLKIGRTTVTGIVDRLEAEALITRSIDPQDKRSFILQLTEKGRELIRQIEEVRLEQLSGALCLMDTADLDALYRGLVALSKALKPS
jgi:DNA-binding MarR family transcriptional regulator